MQLLLYLLAYPLLWFISILPFRLLYLLSDLAYVLIFRMVGYRKKVVMENLRLVFPETSEEVLNTIRKEFYRHMCDLFLEMIKTFNLKEAQLLQRFPVVNIELLRKLELERSVLILFSHYGNWEWSIFCNRLIRSRGYAVYQKLNNPYFDHLIRKLRTRWNTTPISQKATVRTVMKNEQEGLRAVYGIVSDQSPQAHLAQYWCEFMGIRVPVYNGPELLARRLNTPVLFAKISKIKRGYYSLELIPLSLQPHTSPPHEITEAFIRQTEAQIREAPAYYLWTHRRWKHRDKAPSLT